MDKDCMDFANVSQEIKIGTNYPTHNMTFNKDGKEIGWISWDKGELVFEGNADESAKVFFNDFLKNYVDQYIADKKGG